MRNEFCKEKKAATDEQTMQKGANKFKKAAVALSAIFMCLLSSISLIACNDEKGNNVPKSEINAVLTSLANRNYSYTVVKDGKSNSYFFADTKVEVSKEQNAPVYYENSGDKSASYIYNHEREEYVKDFSKAFDIDSIVYNDLKKAEWKSYDQQSKEILGSVDGEDVSMVIKADGDVTLKGKTFNGKITDVGNTVFSMPADYIDLTIEYAIPLEEIDEIINGMSNKNFTVEVKSSQESASTYLFDGNKSYFEDENGKKITVIDGEKTYEYALNQTDNKWHKTEAENAVDDSSLIIAALKKTEWTKYDIMLEQVTGKLESQTVTLKLNSAEFYVSGQDFNWTISDIRTTSFDMPSGNDVIDETVKPVVNELYSVKDGKIVYDMAAVSEVLTQWIKGDNEFEKDYISVKEISDNVSLNKIIFTNINDRKIEIGTFCNKSNHLGYTIWEIDDTNLLNEIKNGAFETKDSLLTALKGISIKRFNNSGINKNIEYSTYDADYETAHKAEFEKLTSQVLIKLKENGVQDSYTNKDGRKEDLTSMKVLLGFKTPTKAIGAGYDMGYYSEWNQYYLVEIDGKYQLLSFYIASSSTYNPDVVGNVLNGKMGWMIGGLDKKDLDEGHASLYQG